MRITFNEIYRILFHIFQYNEGAYESQIKVIKCCW